MKEKPKVEQKKETEKGGEETEEGVSDRAEPGLEIIKQRREGRAVLL